jgi:glycosyltransferase involved in cell wall biosynthesis
VVEGEKAVMLFRTNTTTETILKWIVESDVLIYTPSGEHFGIVPIEAMCLGTPVIAVNDGAGPTETVLHEVTGLLCNSSEDDFANAVAKLYQQLYLDIDAEEKMANSCREHINNNFSFKVFSEKLDKIVNA